MGLSPDLLDLLSCPKCGDGLKYTQEDVLVCMKCRVCYPVDEGIPDVSVESSLPLSNEGQIVPKQDAVIFSIEGGPETGTHFRLENGTCRALGRRLDDQRVTQIFDQQGTMSFDEQSRRVIGNYVSKFSKKKLPNDVIDESEIGGFNRLPDVVFNDQGVSRLHAMIFNDVSGVGIVDLVSKNGTFVNGKEVEACTLREGDDIIIGHSHLKYMLK